MISGTYLPGTVSPIVTSVTVNATDGVHSSQVTFEWFVSDSAGTNHADLAGPDGGVVTLVSSANAQLKASYFDPASMGAPTAGDGLPVGGIEIEIDGLARGASAQIAITPPRGENLDELLDDSSAGWIDLLSRTGSSSATTNGGGLIVNLADGDIGEFNPAFDGNIVAYLAPVYRQLTASIGNVPSQITVGQSATLSSDLAGALAPTATSTWQVSLNGDVVQTARGASFNFAPQQPGAYTVALTATDPATGISASTPVSISVVPSLGTLNAGTPAGTPFLSGLIDPIRNSGIETITPVTFSALPGSPTRTYVITDSNVGVASAWQYDGSQVSPVLIQGTNQQLTGISATVAVGGGWVAMIDVNDSEIWAVTPDGARLIVSAANGLRYPENPVAVGDTLYFSASDPIANNQLRGLRLDGAGNPVITQVTNLFDETGNNFYALRALTPFAGGLAFIDAVGPYEDGLAPSDEVFVLTAGPTPVKQLSLDPPVGYPNIPSLAVIDGPGGSSRLIFARYGYGGPTSVYSFDSSQLNGSDLSLTKVDIAPAGANVQVQNLLGVGSQLYFTTSDNQSPPELWVSDGTAADTKQLEVQTSSQLLYLYSLVDVNGQLNFLAYDDNGDTSLWAIDSATGDPLEVQDNTQASELLSVGGRMYLVEFDPANEVNRLWSGAGGTSLPTLVPSNPNNPYINPNVIAADDQGVVYFSATSLTVLDANGNSTNQMWVLGPAFGASSTPATLSIATPTDISAGSTPAVTISVLTASGDPASVFAGPVTVKMDDGDGNTAFTTTGNFSGGVFSFQLPALTTGGSADANYSLHVLSNDMAAQASITVHPIVHLAPTSGTVAVAGAGQAFSLNMQATDDRQLFDPNYTGQVMLSYTDGGGSHQLGPVSAVQGIVTFAGVVLPNPGTYTLTATSVDDQATGSFVVTVPKAITFATTASDPTQVSDTQVFDLDIVAADVLGNPAAGYTGLVLVTLTDPNGVSTNTSYYVGPDLQSHLVLKGLVLPVDGQYRLRLSDGIVASTLTINVTQKQVVPGDLNDDGKVDATDIDTLFGMIAAGDAHGDLNNDGAVDQGDLDYLIHNILHTEYGDANLDGFVDTSDLAIVRTKTGSSLSGPDWASGDFNGDGFVDVSDLAVVRRHMGFASSDIGNSGAATVFVVIAPASPATPAATAVPVLPTLAASNTQTLAERPTVVEPAFIAAMTVAPVTAPASVAATSPLASPVAAAVTSAPAAQIASAGPTFAEAVADESATSPPANALHATSLPQADSQASTTRNSLVIGPLEPDFVKAMIPPVATSPSIAEASIAVAQSALSTATVASVAALDLWPTAYPSTSAIMPGVATTATSSVLILATGIDERALRKVLATAVDLPVNHVFGNGFEELIDLLATTRRSTASKRKP